MHAALAIQAVRNIVTATPENTGAPLAGFASIQVAKMLVVVAVVVRTSTSARMYSVVAMVPAMKTVAHVSASMAILEQNVPLLLAFVPE